ncbi:MAG: DUF2218 domain-containing protein [Pauljensenia sp.]
MNSESSRSFDEASATHSPAATSGTPARTAETAPIEAAATAPVDAAPEESTSVSFPLIATASVSTERAARYGKQLVSHMGHKITGSWDEEAGSGYLLFDREGPVLGRFDVIASASDLRLELRTTPERADRLEFIVGIHLARFGARDSLAISWERTDGSEGTTQGPLTPEEVEAHARAKKAAREAGHAASGHATE